jgi:hypothetical protein
VMVRAEFSALMTDRIDATKKGSQRIPRTASSATREAQIGVESGSDFYFRERTWSEWTARGFLQATDRTGELAMR